MYKQLLTFEMCVPHVTAFQYKSDSNSRENSFNHKKDKQRIQIPKRIAHLKNEIITKQKQNPEKYNLINSTVSFYTVTNGEGFKIIVAIHNIKSIFRIHLAVFYKIKVVDGVYFLLSALLLAIICQNWENLQDPSMLYFQID